MMLAGSSLVLCPCQCMGGDRRQETTLTNDNLISSYGQSSMFPGLSSLTLFVLLTVNHSSLMESPFTPFPFLLTYPYDLIALLPKEVWDVGAAEQEKNSFQSYNQRTRGFSSGDWDGGLTNPRFSLQPRRLNKKFPGENSQKQKNN
jgi:hypothetical protein